MVENQKILLFIETGGPGGAERVVASLAASYAALGLEVGVATLRTGWLTEQLSEQGTRHHHIPSVRSADIGLIFRLAKLIKDEGYTLVHSHLLDSNFYAALASRVAGVKHIATEHGDVHHVNRKRLLRTKLKVITWMGAHWTAVSSFSAAALERLGVQGSRVSVIGNPVAESPGISALERKKIRSALGITPESDASHWLWIHVANFRKVKDQRTLIEGFVQSLQTSSQAQSLCLVGDGELRTDLFQLCEELGCTENVHFLGFRDDVYQLLPAADGFILSSKSEALPMALIEASLAKLCILSSEVGGISDLVRHEETGLLFRSGSKDELSEMISKVLAQPLEARALGERAYQFAKAEFDPLHISQRYLALLTQEQA